MTAPAAKTVAKRVAKKTAAKKSTSHTAKHSRPTTASEHAKQAKQVAKKTGSTLRRPFATQSKYAPNLRPPRSVVSYRHVLAAEFYLGILYILYNRVADKQIPRDTNPDTSASVAASLGELPYNAKGQNSTIVQLAGFCVVWAVLFGITSGGRGPARFASWLGGLILLTIITRKEMLKARDDISGILQGAETGSGPGVTHNQEPANNPNPGVISTPGNIDTLQ